MIKHEQFWSYILFDYIEHLHKKSLDGLLLGLTAKKTSERGSKYVAPRLQNSILKDIESWCFFDAFSESYGLNFEDEGGKCL